MKRIWKYTLELTEQQGVSIPSDAKFLDIQTQDDKICAWFEVPDNPKEQDEREFIIIGTGHPAPTEQMKYLKTIQLGSFVWHIYTPGNWA